PVMVVGLGPMTTTEPSNRSSRTPPRKIRTNNRAPGAAEKAHPISGFLQPDEVIEPAAARVVAMITLATRKHPAATNPRTPEYSRKAPSNATRARMAGEATSMKRPANARRPRLTPAKPTQKCTNVEITGAANHQVQGRMNSRATKHSGHSGCWINI